MGIISSQLLRQQLCAVATSATLTTPTAVASAGQDHLIQGQRLASGQQLVRITTDGARTWLVMRADGNLVLYTTGAPVGPRHTCWASNTVHNGSYASYQSDGNFVVYNSADRPTWASGTQNDGGSTENINGCGSCGLAQGHQQLLRLTTSRIRVGEVEPAASGSSWWGGLAD